MLNRLTKIISTFKFVEFHGIPLTVEEGHKQLAQYLIGNGVVLPPCKIGDSVWVLRYYHSKLIPQKGIVSEMKFIGADMTLQIVVKYIGRGEWGKNVFATKKDALNAIAMR